MPDPTSSPNPHAAPDPDVSAHNIVPTPVPGASGSGPAEEGADQLDAANASLAGALSLSFGVLRIVMLLLIAVFLLSGFFTVAPDEVAVRTRFGRIIPGPDGLEVLTPEGGPYFRWPAPVGQVYRVPTVPRRLDLDESFVFRAARHNRDQPLGAVSQGPRLDPEYDGALLTGDQSIVHARYEVSYKVTPDDAARFVRKLGSIASLDDAVTNRSVIFQRADELVRNTVEQAIVEDVAGTTLDRFLRRSQNASPAGEPPAIDGATPGLDGAAGEAEPAAPADAPLGEQQPPANDADQPADQGGEPGAADAGAPAAAGGAAGGQEDQVRVSAQQVLDGLKSGITLVTVTRTEQMVLSTVAELTNAVAVELAQARTKRNQAERYRNNEMIGAAGPSFEAVLTIIDAYEEADRLRESEPEKFARAEQAIAATFDGQALGPVLQSLADEHPADSPQRARLESQAREHVAGRLGGRAGNIVSSASADASAYVAALEAEANRFDGMLALYHDRPDLVRRRMLTNTLRTIFSGGDVETSFVAPGADLHLLLNREREAELQDESRARAARLGQARGAASNLAAPPRSPPPAPGGAAGGDDHDH